MKIIDHIETGFKLVFKSVNMLIGITVGAVFGALLSILIIMMVNDGFSFSGGWYWRLLPGGILGAFVGVKLWPLMLGMFIGGDGEFGDVSLESEVDASADSTTNDSINDKNNHGNGW